MELQTIQIPNICPVKVFVKVRPLIRKQILNHEEQCVYCKDNMTIEVGGNSYSFNKVFDQQSTQLEIYNSEVHQLVKGCFQGYNATLLAYGQTGSGKTFTMGTSGTDSEGLIPLVINDIFNTIQQQGSDQTIFTLKVSFIQLYNECIYDLLADKLERTPQYALTLRQNRDKSMSVVNVKEESAHTREQMIDFLIKGNVRRSTASTYMNQTSSRSHAIFTIMISQVPNKDQVTHGQEIQSKFHFVDLAGSQKLKKTGATGQVKKQGININKGLFHLGEVINALTDNTNSSRQKHIPYKNSKLTRILSDSLGGNTTTQMIACVSPADSNFYQTVNTLKYGSRAMNIKNKPVVNRDPASNQILSLRQRVKYLEQQNQALKMGDYVYKRHQKLQDNHQYKRIVSQYDIKISNLQSDLKVSQLRINEVQLQFNKIRIQKDKLLWVLQQYSYQKGLQIPAQFSVPLIDEYSSNITLLNKQLQKKNNHIKELQKQLNHFVVCSQRDDQIIINKLKDIENLKKQLILHDYNNNNQQSQISDDEQCYDEKIDQQLEVKRNQLNSFEEQVSYQVGEVQKTLVYRQKILKDMSDGQIVLQNQLIQVLKEQYGTRIKQLEHEKQTLEKQIQRAVNNENKNTQQALKVKRQSLQQKLKVFARKVKQQEHLQKMVETQHGKIDKLKDEIGKFKMQKTQLNRKLKQQHQNFEKFKQAKSKDILNLKKLKFNKQKEVTKLQNQNNRKDMIIFKNQKENNNLKKQIKMIRNINKQNFKKKVVPSLIKQPTQQYEIVDNIITQLSHNIQQRKHTRKFEEQLIKIGNEIIDLQKQHSKISLQLLRIENDHNRQQEAQQLKYQINSIEEQKDILYQKELYLRQNLKNDFKYGMFNIEEQILLNPRYDNTFSMRDLLRQAFSRIQKIIDDNKFQEARINNQQLTIQSQKQKIMQLNEYTIQEAQAHRLKIHNLRQELAMRNLNQQRTRTVLTKDQTKKQLQAAQRKIRDLTRQTEQTRKMNQLLSNKYEGAKKMTYKDKYIGIGNRPDSVSKIIPYKERRLARYSSVDKINLNIVDKAQSICSKQSHQQDDFEDLILHHSDIKEQQWNSIGTIIAHQSPIWSLSMSQDMIVSTATKSLKIWDPVKLECQFQITNFQSWVKSSLISPSHNLIFTACQKNINLWDKRTYTPSGVLKKQDIIRTFVLDGNILYSGGNGNQNGGVLIWDIRQMRCIQQKQRKQDIFSMTLHNSTVFYGSRNHHVKLMTPYLDTYTFHPPHYDVVTSLAKMNNFLISGSKDKSIKLWSMQANNFLTQKHSLHLHNKQINTVCTDENSSLIFSGSKDGQVKISTVNRQKLEVISSLNCHSDSVNSMICMNQTLLTGSADKTIKLWRKQ